jgi:hypothetical protein
MFWREIVSGSARPNEVLPSEMRTPVRHRPIRRGAGPMSAVHTHEHAHGEVVHTHEHTGHDHEHVEHSHTHEHGGTSHEHPHAHDASAEQVHEHAH